MAIQPTAKPLQMNYGQSPPAAQAGTKPSKAAASKGGKATTKKGG